jgi:hypothetical protein
MEKNCDICVSAAGRTASLTDRSLLRISAGYHRRQYVVSGYVCMLCSHAVVISPGGNSMFETEGEAIIN